MRADSFRFRPPEIESSAALRWALARAYGPVGPSAAGSSLDPGERRRALDWSKALFVAERIASRVPLAELERDLGHEISAELRSARDSLAARSLLLRGLLDRVAELAAELDCSLVALKGAALLESGHVSWGARPLTDLDLLVARDRGAEVATGLQGLGLRPSGPDERHHLAPLGDGKLGEVELHTALPGLSLDGAELTPESLRQAGLTAPSPRLPALQLPGARLLVGHLIAHAVDQHGWSPAAYPITRLAADLLDLSVSLDRPVAELARGAAPLLDRAVSERELAAIGLLCESLVDDGDLAGEADAGALLAHTIAAMTRPSYRRSIRRRAALKALGRGDWRKLRIHRRIGVEN